MLEGEGTCSWDRQRCAWIVCAPASKPSPVSCSRSAGTHTPPGALPAAASGAAGQTPPCQLGARRGRLRKDPDADRVLAPAMSRGVAIPRSAYSKSLDRFKLTGRVKPVLYVGAGI